MSGPEATERLEEAREIVWDAVQRLEEAQRVLFKVGDCYVADVWGDGVREVIRLTERLTDLTGDLTAVNLEIGHLVRRKRKSG